MTINRTGPAEFQFVCDDAEEARKAKELKHFEYQGGIYLVRRIAIGIDVGPVYTLLVTVK